ncbi:arylsulfatase B-like [Glandiceps talaboti]
MHSQAPSFLYFASSFAFFLCLVSPSLGQTKPHIIFILADDLGWHDVGYHDSIIQTPNIDKLAAEGVKLENYYVTPLCTPTRSVLMTGRNQISTGMQHFVLTAGETRCLPLDEVLLPQKMKESGYATHMVGKWHLGFYKWECTPNHRGFDTFFGFYLAGGKYYNHTRSCFGGKSECWDLRDNDEMVGPQYQGQYSTILYAQKAQEIIRNHDSKTPLFLFLSFQAVHAPLEVPREYEDMYRNKINDDNRRIYAAMTTCMDHAIGNVTNTLREKGLLDNSVIVFSTDNGGSLGYGASNWPLRGQKGTLYEGGVRGAACVDSPFLKPHVRGTMNKELLYVGDWLATFVHLAGGNVNNTKPLDSFNQWETISAGKPSPRIEIVHNIDPMKDLLHIPKEYPYTTYTTFDPHLHAAIRMGNWKVITGAKGDSTWTMPPEIGDERIQGPPGSILLFNIVEDPLESNDLAFSRPDIVYRMLERLKYHNTTTAVLPAPIVRNHSVTTPLQSMAWTPWE